MLRSIKKSYELIKAEDKDTSVTVHTKKRGVEKVV